MRKIHGPTLTALLLLGSLAGSFGSEEASIGLRWVLAAVEDGAAGPVAITRDVTLASGARLKLLVEPLSAGSVYVIASEEREAIRVLHRDTDAAGTRVVLPAGNKWHPLEGEAVTFFVLASSEPLAYLERLLDRYAAADPDERSLLAPRIVGEIERNLRVHRNAPRPLEKPASPREDPARGPLERLAIEVRAKGFYGKAIRVES